MNNRFTLIELIVVIAILGILAAILIPNISDVKQKSNVAAIVSNTKNLQTASDMYRTDNENALPSKDKPIVGNPQPVDYDKLIPDDLRNKPKTKGARYWVDYNGTIWSSTVDAPKVTGQDKNNGTIEWTPSAGSTSCDVYSYNGKDLKVAQSNATSPYTGQANTEYFVGCNDVYSLSTPPVGTLYEPYPVDVDLNTGGNTPAPSTNGIQEGDYIALGSYNNIALKWRVIHSDANGLLLFNTEQVLPKQVYDAGKDSNWENSDVRNYLNTTAYNTLFSAEEKSLISDVNHRSDLDETQKAQATSGTKDLEYLSMSYNSYTGLNFSEYYSKQVQDKLFLLSLEEMVKYAYPYYSNNGNKVNPDDLYDADGNNQNTIQLRTPNDGNTILVAIPHNSYDLVVTDMEADSEYSYGNVNHLQPALYLKADSQSIGGDGTRNNPWLFRNFGSIKTQKSNAITGSDLKLTSADYSTTEQSKTVSFTVPAGASSTAFVFNASMDYDSSVTYELNGVEINPDGQFMGYDSNWNATYKYTVKDGLATGTNTFKIYYKKLSSSSSNFITINNMKVNYYE